MAEPARKFSLPVKFKPVVIITLIAAGIVLLSISTSFFIVDQTERAVITTLGRMTRVAEPGLHFKLPLGIQKSYIVKTEVVQTEQFGFRTEKAGVVTQYSDQLFPEESTMLTGDLNIVDVEWIIQYRIKDPKAWLFNVSDRHQTIRDISQSVINNQVGDRTILDVLGPSRQAVQESSVQIMNDIFASYALGIEVNQVQLQNIVPPKGVQDAFEDVNKAIQDMNRLINEGKEAYNAEIPKARGEADRIVEVSRGYANERVNKAKGDVARFGSVLAEYKKSPDVTRQRLYLEMMDEIFADSEGVELIDRKFTNFLPIKNLDALKEAAR